MSGPRRVARGRASLLLLVVACAPTVSQRPPEPSKRSGQAAPSAAVVPVDAPAPPPPPPPPVIDAEQRAMLDALEAVAHELETPRELTALAATLGAPVTTERQHGWLELTPRAAVLRRIRIEVGRRPDENRVEVTVRTPTNASVLGTRFGVLVEEGFLREFGDAYWLTTCHALSDGASISVDLFFDATPARPATEPTSVVFLERWSPGPYRTCSP